MNTLNLHQTLFVILSLILKFLDKFLGHAGSETSQKLGIVSLLNQTTLLFHFLHVLVYVLVSR